MNKRNWILGALVAVGALFGSSGAQAVITLDNWELNASGVDGLPANPIYDTPDVDRMTFEAHFQQNIVSDTDGNGLPSVGEEGVVNGRGVITSLRNDGVNVSPILMNQNGTPFPGFPGFEVTFDFQVGFEVIEVTGNNVAFDHIGANANNSGLLNIYIDNLGDLSQCSTSTGLGCTDGTLVATFSLIEVTNDGGNINFVTFDGSDDATFEATFLLAGVWFDENGNDLACDDSVAGSECNGDPLGLSDSNLDSDPENDGELNTGSSVFDCGLVNGVSSPLRTCGLEDGSFILASVPEPASLAIFAAGLLMLGTLVGTLRTRAS